MEYAYTELASRRIVQRNRTDGRIEFAPGHGPLGPRAGREEVA